MMRHYAGLGACFLLALISLAPCVQAQAAAGAARPSGPFSYDVSLETTISGKVTSVVTKPTEGMVWGSHLLIETPSGTVDASLGTLAMRAKVAPSFAVGQQAEVTGVMKTINDKQVFLTRTVKVGDQVYTMRNEHGFPVRQAATDRESQQAAQKGVQP